MKAHADLHSQERIWDYFQNETAEVFEGSRNRLGYLARLAPSAGHVLNIGVGGGIFEEIAASMGLHVYSLDPSARAIEAVRARLMLGDRAQVGYSDRTPFRDAQFDAVVLSEVLEHLDARTTNATLKEVARILKPGGLLLGTVPAREDLSLEQVVCPDCGKRFHRWGHQQSFTAVSMRQLLETSLIVERIEERAFPPWNLLNWKGRVAAVAKAALALVGQHGSGENLVFVARRA